MTKRSTRVSGKDYVLHIAVGEKTVCGRPVAKVNCFGNAAEVVEHASDTDMTCRSCAKRWQEIAS